MILSVTVLGSQDGTSPAAVGEKIVAYLEGGRAKSATRQSDQTIELPAPDGGIVTYYADSAGTRPAHWALGRQGTVDERELAVLLAGYDPATGEPLLSGRGSTGRAARERHDSELDPMKQQFTLGEAAAFLGMDVSYLRRHVRQLVLADDAEGIALEGTQWVLERAVVERLAAERKPARIVAGYDLTFSAPKSVSVLWAGGDDATRTAVLDALDEAVAAGMRYLERQAIAVRMAGTSTPASGAIGADYLHTTSRALDSQLHHHVVLVNAATGPDGVQRAIDGRMLFHHAKTASYLAAAELRHQLTARLGVEWTGVRNGIAEVAGIPTEALREMSTRAKEIARTSTPGASARQLQVAAWESRPTKQHGVDAAAVERSWDERLKGAGYDEAARSGVLGRVGAPALFDGEARRAAFDRLLRVDGITEHEAVFDRRAVVRRLAELAEDRLSGDAIDALAERFLAQPDVVALASELPSDPPSATRKPMSKEAQYSTSAMLALEQRGLDAYERGRDAQVGLVSRSTLDRVLSEEHFVHLSDEQRDFVASLVGSGMRIQAGLGAAGTGKTTALRAAVAAWQDAGYEVIGAAVGGTQAVVLGEEAGLPATTVASLLARYYDRDDRSMVREQSVVLVDEASLLSTKDYVALARMCEESDATLRLVGDPAQHSSVEAGGMLRYLVEHDSAHVPTLTTIYRQRGSEMEGVRQAAADLRNGDFGNALDRLRQEERIGEFATASDAYDAVVARWYLERQQWLADATRPWSAMTAERHVDRRELNARARGLLTADESLRGPEIVVGDLSFRAGDEVLARVADRNLREEGAARDAFLRNGSRGVVTEVEADAVVVQFERWGRVRVPREYLERDLTPGVTGGLQHAYAVTTHAAQGETFAMANAVMTETSSPEATYVALTRAQCDLQVAVVDRSRREETDDTLPVLVDERSGLRQLRRHLEQAAPERLASGVHGSEEPPPAVPARTAAAVRAAKADIARIDRERSRRPESQTKREDRAARPTWTRYTEKPSGQPARHRRSNDQADVGMSTRNDPPVDDESVRCSPPEEHVEHNPRHTIGI